MAIYTTFFLCHPNELLPSFPGWKEPLAVPVKRTRMNPFTREQVTVVTREPEWNEVGSSELQVPEFEVVSIEGSYARYLEQRIPRSIQLRPHWCAKNLTSIELAPLISC